MPTDTPQDVAWREVTIPLAYYQWLATIEKDVRANDLEPFEIAGLIKALCPTTTAGLWVVASVKEALRGDYTGAGMEDAFFRWPVIERAIIAALRRVDQPQDVALAEENAWREGFQCARDCLSDNEAFCLTDDVEQDCWIDSKTRALRTTSTSALAEENARLREALGPINVAISELEALSQAMKLLGRGDMESPIETDILTPLRHARALLHREGTEQ